jgi:membrane dipeptidase
LLLPIHRESIVVDCLNAIFPRNFDEQYIHHLREGGIDAIQITIPDVESFSPAYVADELTKLFVAVRKLEPMGVRLATSATDIRRSKSEGGIAVILGTQGSGYLGLNLDCMDYYWRLGMRIMQPTYQQRNQFGSGCGEKKDDGLSELGLEWVRRMNELHMLISLSHAGMETSLDTIQSSKEPVIFTHSNAKALCNHVRNLDDEQIRACAERGGVICPTPVAMFISVEKDQRQLTIGDYTKHIDYMVKLVGTDHVGLGMDLAEELFYTREKILQKRSSLPLLTSPSMKEIEDAFLASGRDKLPFSELYMPPWIQRMADMSKITDALSHSGYSDQDVKKILGENFLRVFEKVVGS